MSMRESRNPLRNRSKRPRKAMSRTMDRNPIYGGGPMDQIWFFWVVFLGMFAVLALLPVWFGLFTKD